MVLGRKENRNIKSDIRLRRHFVSGSDACTAGRLCQRDNAPLVPLAENRKPSLRVLYRLAQVWNMILRYIGLISPAILMLGIDATCWQGQLNDRYSSGAATQSETECVYAS